MVDNKYQLYKDLKSYLQTHFDMQDKKEFSIVIAWALGTYVYDVFSAYPRLVFYGPKQSGKSKMLTFLSKLCNNSQYTIIPSTAAMFRIIQKWKPTLLLDEFNLYSSSENKEVVAILRQGYKKGGQVPRCEKLRIKGEDGSRELQEVVFYDVYCPIAFCGLTINDDQLLDRSIAINLIRSNRINIVNTEIDEKWFDKEKIVTWEGLREKLMDLLKKEEVEECYKIIKECHIPIAGRDKELWTPLLAIARFIGGPEHNEFWDDVVFYMQKYIKRKQEEDLSSFDLRVLAEIERLDDMGKFQAKEIAELLNEFVSNPKEQVTSHAVGHALKRLGIPFKIDTGKKYYTLTPEEYEILKQKFGIISEKNGS